MFSGDSLVIRDQLSFYIHAVLGCTCTNGSKCKALIAGLPGLVNELMYNGSLTKGVPHQPLRNSTRKQDQPKLMRVWQIYNTFEAKLAHTQLNLDTACDA